MKLVDRPPKTCYNQNRRMKFPKRSLALLLVFTLLVGVGGGVSASAGSLAAYPPDGAQFTNQDGWNLVSFEANGPSRHSAFGWVDDFVLIYLESFWERGGEVVKQKFGGQVTVTPGTFTWAIEDESIAEILTNREVPPGEEAPDGTGALLQCLREGKTVLTVTGPQGKVSKCGLVVKPKDTDVPDPLDDFYGDEDFITGDGWRISSFHLHMNGSGVLSTMGVGDVGTLQIRSLWMRPTDEPIPIPEIASGYLNFAPEEFTWSVSDESVAVIRDDYPGTTACSLVALKEGAVKVTATGPLGKQIYRWIHVLPIDEFGDDEGRPSDPGKPPEFIEPKPYEPFRFDIGGWVANLLVNWFLKPLLKPITDAIIELDETGEAEGWIDQQSNNLMELIKQALRPVEQAVEWVVDTAQEIASEVSRVAANAVEITQAVYDLFFQRFLRMLLQYIIQGFFGAAASMFFPRLFPKPSRVDIPQDGNIGTVITYMGYHKITKAGTPAHNLKEDSRKSNRYSIARPEYYALIDGRIAIATKKNIGGQLQVAIGDYVNVEFKANNGVTTIYQCIIGDEKDDGAQDNNWGHDGGKSVVEVIYHDYSPPTGYDTNKNNPWGAGRVISITKAGSYGAF